MPDQSSDPDMSFVARVNAARKTAENAGFATDEFFEIIEAAVTAAIRARTCGKLSWMLSSDDSDVRKRLGYLAFEFGDDLYAVRMMANMGNDVVYSVVQLAEQAAGDTEIATLTIDGIHDAGSVRTRAIDVITRHRLDQIWTGAARITFEADHQRYHLRHVHPHDGDPGWLVQDTDDQVITVFTMPGPDRRRDEAELITHAKRVLFRHYQLARRGGGGA